MNATRYPTQTLGKLNSSTGDCRFCANNSHHRCLVLEVRHRRATLASSVITP
jgi:hypothetical protein